MVQTESLFCILLISWKFCKFLLVGFAMNCCWTNARLVCLLVVTGTERGWLECIAIWGSLCFSLCNLLQCELGSMGCRSLQLKLECTKNLSVCLVVPCYSFYRICGWWAKSHNFVNYCWICFKPILLPSLGCLVCLYEISVQSYH